MWAIDNKRSTEANQLNPGLPIIVGSITHIFYLTLLSGNIPKVWKSALVQPLHMDGDSSDLHHYHPISRIPCLAKILETLVNVQLCSFLSEECILNAN